MDFLCEVKYQLSEVWIKQGYCPLDLCATCYDCIEGRRFKRTSEAQVKQKESFPYVVNNSHIQILNATVGVEKLNIKGLLSKLPDKEYLIIHPGCITFDQIEIKISELHRVITKALAWGVLKHSDL